MENLSSSTTSGNGVERRGYSPTLAAMHALQRVDPGLSLKAAFDIVHGKATPKPVRAPADPGSETPERPIPLQEAFALTVRLVALTRRQEELRQEIETALRRPTAGPKALPARVASVVKKAVEYHRCGEEIRQIAARMPWIQLAA